jgi:chemosensory pili system protein ChpA (sensor histidine kinase/response regulator)
VSENFDSGPLVWVKDEINQALDSVLDNLNTVNKNLSDTSILKFSQTHLYQASGALDMVGLEGCKRYCSELEKLASKLEKKTIGATAENIKSFEQAIKTLQSYLQDLLNGAPDLPLRLYPSLNAICVAQGETIDESELFFPDTTNSAPKDIPSKQLSEAEYPAFIVEQRMAYQKSLLGWLQTKQNQAVNSMTEAVSNVSQAQQKSSNKTLWWAASAFTESLEQKEIAENIGAKKLCRRIDQELKHLTEGISKPHSNLLRDILYYVAISDVDRDTVQKVKEVFELDSLLDKKASQHLESQTIDATEMSVVQQLMEDLDSLKEQWDGVSNTIDFSKVDAKSDATTVNVDNVLITKFADSLAANQTHAKKLSQVVVVDLYAALHQASNTLRDDASKVNHAALIEIAAALNLLESTLSHYQQLDADRVQKCLSELQRLEAISSGESYDKLDTDRAGELDRDTVKAVVVHIKESLKTIEQALDTYFRSPDDKGSLSLTPAPLKQVSAVFEMLGMATPTSLVNASTRFIQHFQQADYQPKQAQFELVAESLSMIGLYADEMPKTRPESDKALEGALQRLTASLHEAGIEFSAPTIVAEPEKVAVKSVKSTGKVKAIKSDAVVETALEAAPVLEPAEAYTQVPAEVPAIAEIAEVTITDKAHDPELQDIYLEEAEEVLAHIAQNLQALRVNITDNDAVVEVRRSYHTLKGSGRTVGLSAMGEVAGKVEYFLNGVLDNKTVLTQDHVAIIENVTATFADWTAELRAKNEVAVNQATWLARIAAIDAPETAQVIQITPPAVVETSNIEPTTTETPLEIISEQTEAANVDAENIDLNKQDVASNVVEIASAKSTKKAAKKETSKKPAAKKPEPQVLIGGTRKMSRAFFEIFMNESMQNITVLEQDVAKLIEKKNTRPEAAAKHAVHKLGSNALAAEFKQMGELARALENWLDESQSNWSAKSTELYESTIKSLAGMWQKISELRNPRSAKSLTNLLLQAADKAKKNKVSPVKLVKTVKAKQPPKVEAPKEEEQKVEAPKDDASRDDKPKDEAKVHAEIAAEIVSFTQSDDIASSNSQLEAEAANTQMDVKFISQSKDYKIGKGLDASAVDQELLTMFIEEAQEIMPEIGAELRAWRAHPLQTQHPDALQRSLHTLKGSARMAGQADLGNAVHELEDLVIRSLKRKTVDIDFDAMFVDLDKVGSYFEQTLGETPAETIAVVKQEDAPPTGRTTDRKAQFLRMRADTLDRMINEAGEISIIRSRMDRELGGFKQSSNDLTESLTRLRAYLRELEIEAETQLQSRISILQEANATFDPLEFDRFTRLQELTRMIAESVNDVATIQTGLLANLGQTEAALQQQSRMNRDLQQSLMGVRMLPFKQISERMQRIVRQTARELNKKVELHIEGENTEIDRSMLDKLGPPLEHLLRNALAHGIETPANRKKQGKPETGVITLKVRPENDEIQISVRDDGMGINLAKIKEQAVKKQFITADTELDEQALIALIFETGFSTADKVSQISGRGVGLDVVRNDISGLGGRVHVNSEFGKGTSFNVNLPVTLSVAQVLVVRAGLNNYALPVGIIEQAQKIKSAELIKAYIAGEVRWADKKYPLHYLPKLLDHQEHQPEDMPYASVLLLRIGTVNIALHVDEVISNQEVVMKPIGPQLARVPGIVGATVTGEGKIMLIINPVQLVARELLAVGAVSAKSDHKLVAPVATKRRAMVVDDSLTMRKVLGRLFERAGYEVFTAKDGMDAIQMLQETTPDVIVTDIEMPRMDGFGLARNIRDDVRTKLTPLVMISSRTADKHRSLAKEIGVDAFFGKPVNDEDLMATVTDLIDSKKKLH